MSIVAPVTVAWQRVTNERTSQAKEIETFTQLESAIRRARDVILSTKDEESPKFTGSNPKAHLTLHPGNFKYGDALTQQDLEDIYITILPGAITQDSSETFPSDSTTNVADLNSFASRVFFAEAEDEFIFDSNVTVRGDFSFQGNILTFKLDDDVRGGFRVEDINTNRSSSITYNIADGEWNVTDDTRIGGKLHSDSLQVDGEVDVRGNFESFDATNVESFNLSGQTYLLDVGSQITKSGAFYTADIDNKYEALSENFNIQADQDGKVEATNGLLELIGAELGVEASSSSIQVDDYNVFSDTFTSTVNEEFRVASGTPDASFVVEPPIDFGEVYLDNVEPGNVTFVGEEGKIEDDENRTFAYDTENGTLTVENIDASSGTVQADGFTASSADIGTMALQKGTSVNNIKTEIQLSVSSNDALVTEGAVLGAVQGAGNRTFGQAIFSGDGVKTQFSIQHGLQDSPTSWQVFPSSDDASSFSHTQATDSEITVYYDSAPPSGTGNVKLNWKITDDIESGKDGQISFDGDGSTTEFQIAHGLFEKPETWQITPTSEDATLISNVTADSSSLIVKFDSAPPPGTENVSFSWEASESGSLSGQTEFGGDGSTSQFQILHGLDEKPATWQIEAVSPDATQPSHATADDSTITIEYDSAPPGGTNNVVLNWSAKEQVNFTEIVNSVQGGTDITVSETIGDVVVNHANTGGGQSDSDSSTFLNEVTLDDRGHVEALSFEEVATSNTGISEDGTEVLSSAGDINFTASNDANVYVQDDGDGTATVDIDVNADEFNSDEFVSVSGDTMTGPLTIEDSLSVSQDVSVGGNIIGTNSFRDLFVDPGEPSGSEGDDGDVWFETGNLEVVESISTGEGVFVNQQTGNVTISHGPTSSVANSTEPITSLTFDQFGHVQTLSSGSEWVKEKFIAGNNLTYTKNFDSQFDIANASYTGASFYLGDEDEDPEELAFNTNGTKMFVVGTDNDNVYEYELYTEFNISSANYTGNSFDVSSEVGNPNEIEFNNNGTKMFIVGSNDDVIYEYNLSTGFDLLTASYTGANFDVSSEDTDVEGFTFNGDGTKMFVAGNSNDNVYEYNLNAGFDLSTASYSGTSFDLSSEDDTVGGLVFNSDGSKMFIIGAGSNKIYKYNLNTNFSLSTASYSDTSFDVSSEDNDTEGLVFSSDGSKMFVVGRQKDTVYEYDTGESGGRAQFSVDISDTDDLDEGSNNLYYTSDRVKNQFKACGDLTYIKSREIEDITTATYAGKSFDISSEDGDSEAFAFSGDGTKMFIVGENNNSVFQYNLTTGFDISTASYSGTSFDVSSEMPEAEGIDFNNAGTKMFIGNQGSSASIYEYNLSTDFDLSTASYSGTSFDVSSEGNAPEGITFIPDGTKMFIADAYNNNINEYGLSTAFDISTASFNTDLDVLSEGGNPTGVEFNSDGTEMYVVSRDDDNVYVYDLNSGFDLSTASYTGTSFDTGSEDYAPMNMRFSSDRTKLFVLGKGNDNVYQYENTTGKACFSIDVSEIDDLLSNSTTDDLTEGLTNQYFTDERAQDAVATALTGGSDIQFTYDDAANEITADFTGTTGGVAIEDDGTEVLSEATTLNFGEVLSATDEGSEKAKISFGGDFGKATFSGDGSSGQFQIPHGLSSTPSYFIVNATSDDGSGIGHVTADGTNINVEYDTPPPSGTDNISLNWFAL